jgi:hypothetical protein
MSPIQASLQKILIECLETMLRPIVRLTLFCGLGHNEFSAAVRRLFIDVASEEYGVRGRPANVAKISAKTGLPRKVVHRHRARRQDSVWTPDDEISPLNTIIHYWRFDERYCIQPGQPRDLASEGNNSFTSLVKNWAGDIPVSTIRQELIREGIAQQNDDGTLRLQFNYSFPERLDEDFLRNAAFSIRHHAETLYHNATLVDSDNASMTGQIRGGRFERLAWTRQLDEKSKGHLQSWVRKEGALFVQRADEYISQLESQQAIGLDESGHECGVSGVGIYFFRDE